MSLTYALNLPFFTKYERQLEVAGVLLLAILALAATVLDGGQLLQFTLLAAVAYWCIVAIIMVRRNGNAGRLDQFLMTWGFPLMFPLIGMLLAIEPIGWLRR